jgi:hypothetical protein
MLPVRVRSVTLIESTQTPPRYMQGLLRAFICTGQALYAAVTAHSGWRGDDP